MYADKTFKIRIVVDGNAVRTLRVSDRAVKNCMNRYGLSFESALASTIRPQFRQGVGKVPTHPAAYGKVYRASMLRECVTTGQAESERVRYELVEGHVETDEMQYKANQ